MFELTHPLLNIHSPFSLVWSPPTAEKSVWPKEKDNNAPNDAKNCWELQSRVIVLCEMSDPFHITLCHIILCWYKNISTTALGVLKSWNSLSFIRLCFFLRSLQILFYCIACCLTKCYKFISLSSASMMTVMFLKRLEQPDCEVTKTGLTWDCMHSKNAKYSIYEK